jgi:glycerate kinase
VVSALAAEASARRIPVLVLAGQVTLDESALRAAGIVAAFAVADYAGSVQLAIDDAANQLAGVAAQTAAELPVGWGHAPASGRYPHPIAGQSGATWG